MFSDCHTEPSTDSAEKETKHYEPCSGTVCGLRNSMANSHNNTKIQKCSIEREDKGDMVYSPIFNVQPRLSA